MRWLLILLLIASPAYALPVVIGGVPSYPLTGGLGSGAHEIFGYYNPTYDGLLTGDLEADIAASNAYLNIRPDGTVDGSELAPMIEAYSADRGHPFAAENLFYFFFSFDDYRAEIDAGRPVVIVTDESATWFNPYEVAGVGYDIINGVGHFGFVDRLTQQLRWHEWREADITHAWGVSSVVTMTPPAAPVPEPATWLLLAVGLVALSGMKTLQKRQSRPRPRAE